MKKITLIILLITGCKSVGLEEEPKKIFEIGPPLQHIPFKMGSVEILPEGITFMDKWAKFYLIKKEEEIELVTIVSAISCETELKMDSFINLKRCAKVLNYMRNKHNIKNIYINYSLSNHNCSLSKTLYPYATLKLLH